MRVSNHITVAPTRAAARLISDRPPETAVQLVAVPADKVSEAILTPNGILVGFVFRQPMDIRARLVVARDRWEWHADLAKRWGVHGVYGQRAWLKQMVAEQSSAPTGRAIIFP